MAGLADFWSWLGQALLILSPLLIAGGLIWWIRRRQRRASARRVDPRPKPEPTTPDSPQTSTDEG